MGFLGAADEGDSAAAPGEQVGNGEVGALDVVEADAASGGSFGVAGEVHQGDSGGKDGFDFFGSGGDGGDEDAVHLFAGELEEGVFFAFEFPVGVAEEYAVSGVHHGVFNAEDEAGKERVGDVGDDEADGFGGAVHEALGDGVGAVSHFTGDGGDTLTGSGAYAVFAVEGPGNRGV